MTDSAAISYSPSEAAEPYMVFLALCPLNSRCRSKESHWGCQGFTQVKGGKLPLPQEGYSACPDPSGFSGGHFSTAVPLGAGGPQDWTAHPLLNYPFSLG